MNYITLNGYKSTLIKGLLISELPPITKPLQRSQIEEIDGRDGDVVTKLGYAAYDKKMTIGCYGDFNIDDIIQFFDSEGTVVFSNEPDKFYRYKILQSIDFERLCRFKTASVVFHVQPFKFSAVDDIFTYKRNRLSYEPFDITRGGLRLYTYNNEIRLVGSTAGTTTISAPIHHIMARNGVQYEIRFSVASGGSSSVIASYKDENGGMMGGSTLTLDQSRAKNFTQSGNATFETLDVTVTGSTTVDLVFASEVRDLSKRFTLNNRGNVYSRPKITLYGSGDVTMQIYDNNTDTIDVTIDSDYITLDGETLNAYKGSTLKNRSVTGDLKNLRVNAGEHDVQFSGTGTVTQAIVEDYSRWI